MLRPVLFSLLVTVMLSCRSSSPTEPEPKQYSVPARVEPFVQAFRDAARLRNQTVATDNLIVSFGKAQGSDVCAECLRQAGRTPRIVIDSASGCWQNASSNERECLVFHELGHCLLLRDHRPDRFPKGQYVSLMNLGDLALYATCTYPIGNDVCDKRARQSYYHDELFDPSIPAPAWGK
jgi:hypothetical protein